MYKHILIPTDGSARSRRAAENAVKLAKLLGARVTGFYAAPPAVPLQQKGLLPVYVDPQKQARSIQGAAARYLAMIEDAAKVAGVPCKTISVTNDFPADAIIAAASKYRCDLIFIASHGRRGFRASMLGSQTEKLLRQSKVPVLVDRGG